MIFAAYHLCLLISQRNRHLIHVLCLASSHFEGEMTTSHDVTLSEAVQILPFQENYYENNIAKNYLYYEKISLELLGSPIFTIDH